MNEPQPSDRPRPDDAVLGNQTPPPIKDAVLGGLEGVKHRYESDSISARIAALQEALQHNNLGLQFIIQALQDPNGQIRRSALRLLHDRPEPHVRQALQQHLRCLSQGDIDYEPLQNLLFAEQWEKADRETRAILLKIVYREPFWLDRDDIDRLPCEDLGTLDRLWGEYSGDRFGFSVQARILAACETGDDFVNRVGWRPVDASDDVRRTFDLQRRNDIPFDLSAPPGHLPTTFSLGGGKKESKAYTTDTESVMGFYSIDGYRNEWTRNSFFGLSMVRYFLRRFNRC